MGFKNKLFLALLSFFPFCLCAKELKALDHFVCFRKKATVVETRSLRIHQFPVEKRCAVIYSVKGKDRVLFQGKWLAFCQKKAHKTAQYLQESLWDCKKQTGVQVFYPIQSVNYADPV